MPDPKTPLSLEERAVFGVDAKRHPITGYVLEQCSSALPDDIQAQLHCQTIEQHEGKVAAEVMRAKLRAYMAAKAEVVSAAVKQILDDERSHARATQ